MGKLLLEKNPLIMQLLEKYFTKPGIPGSYCNLPRMLDNDLKRIGLRFNSWMDVILLQKYAAKETTWRRFSKKLYRNISDMN